MPPTSTEHPPATDLDELAVLARRYRGKRAGDDALEELLERFGSRLSAIVRRYRWSAMGRDDLLQEARIGLLRAVDRYDPGKGPFAPFGFLVARSSCKDAATAAGRGEDLTGDREEAYGLDRFADGSGDLAEAVAASVDREAEARRLAAALARIPEQMAHAALSTDPACREQRRRAEAMLRHPCLRAAIAGWSSTAADASRVASDPKGCLGRPVVVAEGVEPAPDPSGGWLARAACREAEPLVFFPRSRAHHALAAGICAGCGVSRQCLADALSLPERGGVRAGTDERQRRRMKGSL